LFLPFFLFSLLLHFSARYAGLQESNNIICIYNFPMQWFFDCLIIFILSFIQGFIPILHLATSPDRENYGRQEAERCSDLKDERPAVYRLLLKKDPG
jgi:hypothetical protein